MPIYFGRLRLRNLTLPPPPFRVTMRKQDAARESVLKKVTQYYFGWISHVLNVDDKTLISTSGLDAFAFLRVCQFGLQLFMPLAILSMGILMPTHLDGDDLQKQHDEYVLAHGGNVTTEKPGGLLLTTVANITRKRPELWLHTVGMLLTVAYAGWLLKQHSATFVVLRTLYLTTRGDTNLWQVVHQPSNFIEQMLLQGTSAGAEIDDDDLRRMKSANSDDVGDALAALDEVEDEHKNLLSRAVEVTAKSTKNILVRSTTIFEKRDSSDAPRRSLREESVSPQEPSMRRPSTTKEGSKLKQSASPSGASAQISPFVLPSQRRVSSSQTTSVTQGNVAQGLKGAGSLLKSSATPDLAATKQPSPGLSTPKMGGATTFQTSTPSSHPASEEEKAKTPPGPVTESKQVSSFASSSLEGLEGADLSINPPVSEPPSLAKRRQRKLKVGSFSSFGAVPASVSQDVRKLEEAQEGFGTSGPSMEDLSKVDLMKGLMGDQQMKRSESSDTMTFVSPKRSPRRNKHARVPTLEEFTLDEVTLTPAVKRALQRVRSMENARELSRTHSISEEYADGQGPSTRSGIAIDHDWWIGLDVTKEYDKSLRVSFSDGSEGDGEKRDVPVRVPEIQRMDGDPKRNLESAFTQDEQADSPGLRGITSPVSRASLTVGKHLSDAPSAVPDVNSIRTVNAYDQATKQLVSVWASSYTVLITDIPFARAVDENGEEMRVRGLRQVEATLEYIYGDEFRGLIPIFDHRPVDALLDSYDECKNELKKLRLRMAREGNLPTVHNPENEFEFGARLSEVKSRTANPWYDFQSFTRLFADVLWRPKRFKKLTLGEQLGALEAQMKALEEAIVSLRKLTWEGSPGPCCFAVFENQLAASTAAQCVISRASHRIYRALPAPGPDDINWQTLLRTTSENRQRAMKVWPIILLLMFVPSGMFSTAVTSFCKVQGDDSDGFLRGETFNWYCSSEGKYVRVLLSGVLPPVILTLWEVFVISFYMLYLVQKQNAHVSLSATDRRFLRFYFAWGAINVVLGGIFGGSLTLFISTLSSKDVTLNEVQIQFGRVLPLSSNFFLLFIVFRAVYLPVQRLLLPHPGAICLAADIFWCSKRGKCARTSRDRTRLYSPRAVRMGREIGVFMLVMLIGLTFVNIAPLIPLACSLFYLTNFIIWRYHVLYVYERGYESNGSVWFAFTQLVLLSLVIAQTFLSCVLFSKQAYIQGAILYVIVPYYVSRIYRQLKSEYGSASSWSVPLSEATAAPPTDFGGEIYTHPALRPAASGWFPDIGKIWKGYPGVTSKNNS